MGSTTDMTPERNATKEELQQYKVAHERIQQLDTSNTYNAADPNQRLVVISFDGTRNDRSNPDPGNIHTNPDLLNGMVQQSDTVKTHYVPGVATRNTNLVEHYNEAITGDGCKAKAEVAYKELIVQVQQWHAENPNVEVHLSTVGFSRGTGSQRHFANLVEARGIPDPSGTGYLIPPGGVHQDVMLIYDSVVTGQEDVLDLGIPDEVVAVHFTADHENRINFDSASIVDPSYRNDSGILEYGLPGAHSDIGGNYDYNGLSARSLELGHELLSRMGVPIDKIPAECQSDPNNTTIHDSGSLLNPADWEYGEREVDIYGNPQRVLNSEEIGQTIANVDEALDEYFAIVDAKNEHQEGQDSETAPVNSSSEENAVDSAKQEAEAQHRLAVEAGERTRGADLDVIYAQNGFHDAISSGDGLSIISAGLDYYAKLEDRADLGRDGYAEESGSLSTSEEALLDSVGSAISLGQAIDSGDGLVIAGESIGLLRNIDCYLDEAKSEYGKVIGTTGSALLGLGAAGIGLAQAIEYGNDLGIAKSSVELLEGIDSYIGGSTALDTALGFDSGDALKGVGSAIGLAINISQLDDVFESGDAGAIACTVTGTVSNAIGTYNAVASMAGASGIAGSAVPVLGFVTAGIQLMQGDVVGAAFSAASAAVAMAVACGLMSTGIGAIAGLAIMAIQMLISDDDPPEASATFSLDADGNLVMETHGDSAMQETARSYGNSMIALMENYQQNGGRLLIDGSLPALRVVQGENSAIEYRSETGGRVSVVLVDMSQAMQEMSAALYARDRGERLESAVEISREIDGSIDLAEVDRIMAGHGFGKTGMTYTYGETKELTGFSFGSGVFKGGGNVGPEGRHFVARDRDIKSLPLRDDQLPAQTMGEIIKIVGLNNAFAGAGAELLAMAMMSGGLLGLAAPAGAAPIIETNGDWTRPLDGFDLESYLLNPRQSVEEAAKNESNNALEMPALTDPTQMHRFLEENWGELLCNPSDFNEIPDSAYFYRQPIGFDGLRSDGTRPGWIGPSHQDDPLFHQRTAAQGQPDAALANEEYGHAAGASFTGYRVALEPADAAGGPRQESGPFFIMAEDSSLRFLLSELTEETTPGSYGRSEDGLTFVSFGRVENGRVYQEANGDIRFEPTAGFVGTGSFTYTVRNEAGELIEKQATVQVENVNDSPKLQVDAYTLAEGEPFYLDTLLANDSDPEGDPLTIDHLRGLAHGEISLSDGRLVFIPEEGYHGDVEFSYWVRDHTSSYPVMATATLTYLDRNTGVSIGADRFIVLEDHSLSITVDKLLANDIEHDGENIHFTGLGAAVHGTAHHQPDGTILFTPEPDYAGTTAGFGYNVEDDSGNSSTGWVSVEVLDAREAPVVIAGTRGPILEDEILAFTPEEIAAFIDDADGDAIRFEFITNVTGGTIVAANGCYSFVPDRDYTGPASFDYRANDNHRGVVDGHLEFAILPVNDPVETGEDILATMEDQPVTVSVDQLLANDRDVDGSTVTFVAIGGSAHGTAVLAADNTVVFTPDGDYAGEEAGFEYLVQDSEGLESVGLVQVRVSNVNDAPEIIAQSLSLSEDQPLTFDAATLAGFVRDADNDKLTLTGVAAVTGGTAAEADSVYTFTPDSNFHGNGSIELTVADEHGETATATLALDILGSDDPATLGEDFLAAQEEQSVGTTVAELLANDDDADGPLEFVGLGKVFHGAVQLSGLDEIHFTPDKDYFGDEAGFEYIVSDPDGYEATGRVMIRVENVNDAPRLIGNTLVTDEDRLIVFDAATIAGFIADLDGDDISLTSISDVSGGTLEKNSGIYTFIPDKEYHGPAFFRYSSEDGHGGQVSGELNLEILSVDDPTIFGDNTFSTNEEQLLVTSVAELLENDSDADGALEFLGVGEARHGEVRVLAGGAVEFMPEPNYFGDNAGFSCLVRDEEGHQATGWVTVKVENINDIPEIIANRLHLQEDESIAFTRDEVAKFLIDSDCDLFSLDLVTNVEGGRLEQNGDIYTFIPDKDFYGEASLDYLATNGSGEQLAGTLAITIGPVNDLPITTYRSAAGIEDGEVTMTVAELMAGASDIEDGTNLRFAGIDSSLHGGVYVDADEIVHFLPDKDFFGSGFFRYNVVDSEGGVGTGYVGIEIAGVNDIPVAMDDDRIVAWSNKSYENVYLASTLLANDFDVDGDPLRLVAAGAAEFGTVTVDGLGNVHYVAPADDWVGVDRFSYEISDGHGGTSTATAEIDVKINTSPDVYSELIFTREDIVSPLIQQDLLGNDHDIDGDIMRVIAVDQAEHCSVSLQADGSIAFVPELNFNNNYPGQASFCYTVTDGISDPVTSVAFFDIEPVNDKPILTGERIEGAVEDNSFSFTAAQLMANDTDVEMSSPYEEDAIGFAGVWGADYGSISWDADSGVIFYNPVANFCGVETFSYAVVDSYGAESVVTSEIYVKPVNDYPVIQEDIGSTAEDSIWNSYSIGGLVANDFDVDGDSLTIKNPSILEGNADVQISGGNLMVKPGVGEDRVVIGYTVSDGHGGEVASKLTIPDIREHNFAPTFSGVYQIAWKNSYTVWFNFHAEDQNGGNTWGESGDIVAISASAPNVGSITDEGYTFKFKGDTENASLVLTAIDEAGATGSIYVRVANLSKVDGNHIYSPVVFDLDGDGVELLGLAAGLGFDWDRDGEFEKTGWVGKDDGFLVYDYDRDRAVRYAGELALKEYDPEAATDLEGLRAFDSSKDGVFDNNDAEWDAFGVWQDKNSDGVTDEGEFAGLDELGICSLSLQSDGNFREQNGNIVFGTTAYQKTDGSTGELADVGLGGEPLLFTEIEASVNLLAAEEDLPRPSPDQIVSENEEVVAEPFAGEEAVVPSSPQRTAILEDRDEPSEQDEQELETEPFATENVAEISPENCEADLPFDDAEIDRQCLQLLSDMAGSLDAEPIESFPSGIDIVVADYPGAPVFEMDQDSMAIA